MICPNCNSQIPDGGFFCPECGMRIPQTAAAVAVAAAVPEEPAVAPQVEAGSNIPAFSEPEPPISSGPAAPQIPDYGIPVYPEMEIPVYTEPEDPKKAKKEKKAKKVKEPKVKEPKVKEPKTSSGKKSGIGVLAVVLAVLLLAAIGLNVWQYLSNAKTVEELEDQISAHEKTIADNAKTITGLEKNVAAGEKTVAELTEQLSSGNSTVEGLNKEITDLTEKLQTAEQNLVGRDAVINEQAALILSLEPSAANYEAIVAELAGQNVGYAADNFCADTDIIVLSMSEVTKQFYLTANWPEGAMVSMELSSYAADVNFDKDSWESGTTMTVTALEPGVCIATFSNNLDDGTFKVLIIVTE